MNCEKILKSKKILHIREAKLEDAKNMIDYLNIVGGESDNLTFGKNEMTISVEDEEKYIKSINNSKNARLIVGVIDNKLVSVSQISGEDGKRIQHNSSLSISVKKEYWGLGIGSLMMNAMIEFAKQTGTIKNINLTVNSTNERAISLYKKFGFEVIGHHKNYTRIGDTFYDETLMDLYLD